MEGVWEEIWTLVAVPEVVVAVFPHFRQTEVESRDKLCAVRDPRGDAITTVFHERAK